MGVVLNRPSETSVGEAVPELASLAGDEEPLFVGGPVVDGRRPRPRRGRGSRRRLRARARRRRLRAGSRRRGAARPVFIGYAGWSPGQIESELGEQSWIVVPAEPDDVFSDEPGELWSRVLRRQGGGLALLATMPLDPSLN